jgi:hypothetical protein
MGALVASLAAHHPGLGRGLGLGRGDGDGTPHQRWRTANQGVPR